MRCQLHCVAFVVLLAGSAIADPSGPSTIELTDSGAAATLADSIRREVEAAIAEGKLPGCVVLIGREGDVLHREAYGHRRLAPQAEAMTVDTVFDLASLTKPVATATSVMILIEASKLRLDDPVAKHLPRFAANGKDAITVEHLLLHTGGLIADNPLGDYEHGRDRALDRIYALKPLARPGERFIYTDVGYIVLGMLVEEVGGQSLDEFARDKIFKPLAMNDTSFCPVERLRARAAPADKHGDEWLVGRVHDPRAARLAGVAGHAGVFSTADDLAKYAQAMLDGGRHGEIRFISGETWTLMTQPRDVPGSSRRALGWDIQSGYSTNRGRRLSAAAFGHGGFTGTSLWIDPEKQLYVIFLSNRLHPDGKGSVNSLAGRIAEVVVESLEQ